MARTVSGGRRKTAATRAFIPAQEIRRSACGNQAPYDDGFPRRHPSTVHGEVAFQFSRKPLLTLGALHRMKRKQKNMGTKLKVVFTKTASPQDVPAMMSKQIDFRVQSKQRGVHSGSIATRSGQHKVRPCPFNPDSNQIVPQSCMTQCAKLRKWTGALVTYILAANSRQLSIGIAELGLLNYVADLWGF